MNIVRNKRDDDGDDDDRPNRPFYGAGTTWYFALVAGLEKFGTIR